MSSKSRSRFQRLSRRIGGLGGVLVLGLLAGAGSTYLLQFYAERARSKPSTPYLIIGGAVAALIAIAIFVNVARF